MTEQKIIRRHSTPLPNKTDRCVGEFYTQFASILLVVVWILMIAPLVDHLVGEDEEKHKLNTANNR